MLRRFLLFLRRLLTPAPPLDAKGEWDRDDEYWMYEDAQGHAPPAARIE